MVATKADPKKQLASFIAKFDAKNQAAIRKVRGWLRKRFPTAHELVYDNYNFFVIGYSPTERPSDSILSMACDAKGIAICFWHGTKLADPKKVLRGSGNQVRSFRLETPAMLDRPEVKALIDAATKNAKPMPATGKAVLVIRAVSAKQRPRKKAAVTKKAR